MCVCAGYAAGFYPLMHSILYIILQVNTCKQHDALHSTAEWLHTNAT